MMFQRRLPAQIDQQDPNVGGYDPTIYADQPAYVPDYSQPDYSQPASQPASQTTYSPAIMPAPPPQPTPAPSPPPTPAPAPTPTPAPAPPAPTLGPDLAPQQTAPALNTLFYGFDPAAHVGQTPTVTEPKYAVYNYLQNVDPRSAWAPGAAAALNAMFNTTQFHALDEETLGYGDEYVHSGGPGGQGGGSLSNPGAPGSPGAFTWGYTGSGGSTSSGSGAGSSFSNFLNSSGLGNLFNNPNNGGIFGDYRDLFTGLGPGNNVGQDPFSQLITGKLSELIANNGYLGPDTEALNLENARTQADRARQSEMAGVMSELANRGLLPENVQGGMGGLALDALGRIERNDVAPLFASATRDYQINQANQARSTLMQALSQGTERQNVLSNIALQTLAQNQAFNQFLATFGLDREKTLAELQLGQNQQLIQLLQLWLNAADISAGGFV